MILLFISLIGNASAKTSYCCEKTKEGAWCQPGSENSCDRTNGLRASPTSCESTSYCKLGTCYNSQKGTCNSNTAQKICEANGGTWDARKIWEISQCNSGCCVLGNEGKWTTQTKCKFLTSKYGLNIDFRTSIKSEIECILIGRSNVLGACVFTNEETGFGKTCKFITKGECDKITSASFHEGLLCSAEELETICGHSEKTTCIKGEDKIYFIDSCGNRANIYDASKINDKNYWREIYSDEESCGYGKSNINSKTCGNCDYFLGSVCSAYKKNTDKNKPAYGDNICRDLSCTYNGKKYEHGEKWCETNNIASLKNQMLPGTESYVLECRYGEVVPDPCSEEEGRSKICIEEDVNGISNANCFANKWQDCTEQKNQGDCENKEARDCKWIEEGTWVGLKQCVPKYAPGFAFWDPDKEEETKAICNQGSYSCTITFKKHLWEEGWEDKDCEENCECLEESWKNAMNAKCSALGDCGSSVNYLGKQGWYTRDNLIGGSLS